MATLKFLGAAQQVTGSCYLLRTAHGNVLLECGMMQEGNDRRTGGESQPPAVDPRDLSAVVVSHAHLDHSGLLPLLCRNGYRGPIYATGPTCELFELMLKDAAFLQERDVEWENRRRQRSGREPVEPLYTIADVERVLAQRRPIPHRQRFEPIPGIDARFMVAGHIMGSAIVELRIAQATEPRTLVFSGDLGNSCSPLMRDPDRIEHADLLLLESTYGDRDHRPADETVTELAGILAAADKSGGNVLIPAFAVGRTQDLIYHLGKLYQQGLLPQARVFIDSPMAIEASELYERHARLFNEDDPEFRAAMSQGWEGWLPILQYTRSAEESMRLNRIQGGAIIIAGSGMCTGGRIRHHLKHNLWNKRNHVVMVGFQARGTPGRALVDGAERVRLVGEEIAVRAPIHTLGGLSAHAGQSQLIEWACNFEKPRPRLCLIHGELEKMLAMQQRLVTELGWDAHIPVYGEVIQV